MRYDPLQLMYLVYRAGDTPSQTTTTTVNQLYSPEEAARRAKLMAEAERIYTSTQGTAQNNKPGPSAETLQAQQILKGIAGQQGGQVQQMGQQVGDAQTFGFNAALNPTASPGFQDVLSTSLRKVNESYTGPAGPFAAIRGNFTAGNSGGSGTREGIAMGMAGRDYLNTVGDVTGKLTSDAYNKGLDVFSRTMAMAPQNMQTVQGAQTYGANILGGLGAQNENFAEQQRIWETQAPWASLQPYAQAVHGMSNPSQQTQQTTPGAQGNPLAPVGGAMMGASLASMIGFNPILGAGAGLMLSLFS